MSKYMVKENKISKKSGEKGLKNKELLVELEAGLFSKPYGKTNLERKYKYRYEKAQVQVPSRVNGEVREGDCRGPAPTIKKFPKTKTSTVPTPQTPERNGVDEKVPGRRSRRRRRKKGKRETTETTEGWEKPNPSRESSLSSLRGCMYGYTRTPDGGRKASGVKFSNNTNFERVLSESVQGMRTFYLREKLSLSREDLFIKHFDPQMKRLPEHIYSYIVFLLNKGDLRTIKDRTLISPSGIIHWFSPTGEYVGNCRPRIAKWVYARVAGTSRPAYVSFGGGKLSVCHITTRFPTLTEFVAADWAKGYSSLEAVSLYVKELRRNVRGSTGYCWLPLYLKSTIPLSEWPETPLVRKGDLEKVFGRIPLVRNGEVFHYDVKGKLVKGEKWRLVGSAEIVELDNTDDWSMLNSDPDLSRALANVVSKTVLKDTSNFQIRLDSFMDKALESKLTRDRQSRIRVSQHLNSNEIDAVKSYFGFSSIEVGSSIRGPHPILNACREILNNIYRMAYGSVMVSDIGGSLTFHQRNGSTNTHVCCPVVDGKDSYRHVSTAINLLNSARRMGDDVGELLRTIYTQSKLTVCCNAVPKCTVPSTVLTLVDVYDISINALLKAMEEKGAVLTRLCFMFPPELLCSDGTVTHPTAGVTACRTGSTISYSVGACGDLYVHDVNNMLKIINSASVVSESGLNYSVELLNQYGPYMDFSICLSRANTLRTVRRRKMVAWLSGKTCVRVEINDAEIPRRFDFVVDRDFVRRMLAYVGNVCNTVDERTYEYVLSNLRSQTTMMVVGTKIVHNRVEIPNEVILEVPSVFLSEGVRRRKLAVVSAKGGFGKGKIEILAAPLRLLAWLCKRLDSSLMSVFSRLFSWLVLNDDTTQAITDYPDGVEIELQEDSSELNVDDSDFQTLLELTNTLVAAGIPANQDSKPEDVSAVAGRPGLMGGGKGNIFDFLLNTESNKPSKFDDFKCLLWTILRKIRLFLENLNFPKCAVNAVVSAVTFVLNMRFKIFSRKQAEPENNIHKFLKTIEDVLYEMSLMFYPEEDRVKTGNKKTGWSMVSKSNRKGETKQKRFGFVKKVASSRVGTMLSGIVKLVWKTIKFLFWNSKTEEATKVDVEEEKPSVRRLKQMYRTVSYMTTQLLRGLGFLFSQECKENCQTIINRTRKVFGLSYDKKILGEKEFFSKLCSMAFGSLITTVRWVAPSAAIGAILYAAYQYRGNLTDMGRTATTVLSRLTVNNVKQLCQLTVGLVWPTTGVVVVILEWLFERDSGFAVLVGGSLVTTLTKGVLTRNLKLKFMAAMLSKRGYAGLKRFYKSMYLSLVEGNKSKRSLNVLPSTNDVLPTAADSDFIRNHIKRVERALLYKQNFGTENQADEVETVEQNTNDFQRRSGKETVVEHVTPQRHPNPVIEIPSAPVVDSKFDVGETSIKVSGEVPEKIRSLAISTFVKGLEQRPENITVATHDCDESEEDVEDVYVEECPGPSVYDRVEQVSTPVRVERASVSAALDETVAGQELCEDCRVQAEQQVKPEGVRSEEQTEVAEKEDVPVDVEVERKVIKGVEDLNRLIVNRAVSVLSKPRTVVLTPQKSGIVVVRHNDSRLSEAVDKKFRGLNAIIANPLDSDRYKSIPRIIHGGDCESIILEYIALICQELRQEISLLRMAVDSTTTDTTGKVYSSFPDIPEHERIKMTTDRDALVSNRVTCPVGLVEHRSLVYNLEKELPEQGNFVYLTPTGCSFSLQKLRGIAKLRDTVSCNFIDVERPKWSFVNAVPGAGKTYEIKQKLKSWSSALGKVLVVTATRLSAEELTSFVDEECECSNNVVVKTADSLTMGDQNILTDLNCVLVDECYMIHAGQLLLLLGSIQPKKVFFYGDRRQIPFINRLKAFVSDKNVLDATKSKYEERLMTYRCPPDICAWMSVQKLKGNEKMYAGEVKTHNGEVLKSVKREEYSPNDIRRYLESDKIMTFTQMEKAGVISLIDKLGGLTADMVEKMKGKVNTVAECQGKTYRNVVLLRTKLADDQTFSSLPHRLVALSRHTSSLTFVCISRKMSAGIGKDVDYIVKLEEQVASRFVVKQCV